MDDITNQNVPEIELDLDHMISIKLHLEMEYNISDANDEIIFELIQYLRDMNISTDKIKTAMYLLYDTIDSSKKNLIDSILAPRNLSNLFSNFIINNTINENIDVFTGDIINPANIINTFAQNMNNIPNMYITFNTNNLNNLNTYMNTIIPQYQIFPFNNVLNFPLNPTTTSTSVLDEKTKVILYREVDVSLKSKYETCFICLADFDEEDTIRKITCEHIFHKDCIDPWLLKESYKCPVCRSDLLAKDDT